MTNFHHINQAWDLQQQDGVKLTDFTGQLENTIKEAAVHIKAKFKADTTSKISTDTVFWLMSAMLMSEKVKTWTPNIYRQLVKAMDSHYTASGIANDAKW